MDKISEWRTRWSITSETWCWINRINSIVEQYRVSNPEWFKNIEKKWRFYEHYSPELVEILLDIIKPEQPNWYQTFNQIAHSIWCNRGLIAKIFRNLQTEEHIKTICIRWTNRECVSPDAVNVIKKTVESIWVLRMIAS